MQTAVQTPATPETNFLYVKNLAPYFHREDSQIKFRQVDAGFARHDPQYNKISLYINAIPAQTVNRNGVCEWRFSIALRNMDLQTDKFFRVRSLRRYYKKVDDKYGYFSNDAGYAVVHDYKEIQFMNLFVNELPAQTQNKDGVLQFRFEVLLAERRENSPQVPSSVQPVQPRPANYNNDFENDDDIPF